MHGQQHPPSEPHLQAIEGARRALAAGDARAARLEPWIQRSWRRCLAQGRAPHEPVSFDVVSPRAPQRMAEAHQPLLKAAAPVMAQLARAIARTHYFAILTNAQGVVIAADGAIDRRDRRADLITRIGVDLSERAVGSTAISAALTELRPVWLHRGEHFFEDTSVYSCAGAPLFGARGECVGMLDVTGIATQERPELRRLVTHSARAIENALVLAHPHALLLRMNWPGSPIGLDDDALVCLDADGQVMAANAAAREMIPALASRRPGALPHCGELFAMPWEQLYDNARAQRLLEAPLWSGLTAQLLASRAGAAPHETVAAPAVALKEVEVDLIRKAVREARGNVMEAARRLGISRATIYRRLRP